MRVRSCTRESRIPRPLSVWRRQRDGDSDDDDDDEDDGDGGSRSGDGDGGEHPISIEAPLRLCSRDKGLHLEGGRPREEEQECQLTLSLPLTEVFIAWGSGSEEN